MYHPHMKILGTKFFGHDNAVFLLDTTQQTIFALSAERVTRIKHDRASIKSVVEKYPELLNVDNVTNGYLYSSSIHYYKELLALDAIYTHIKPKYVKELVAISKNRYKLLKILLKNLKITDLIAIALWSIIEKLFPKHYHFSQQKITSFYCKILQIEPNKIKHYDHHLCHAISAYVFSPYYKSKACLSLTLDGDGYFSKLYQFDNQGNYQLLGQSSSNLTKTSIGLMYSEFTEALDLIPDSDEGKVEALAAFAQADPLLLSELKSLIQFDHLDMVFDCHKNNTIKSLDYLRAQRSKLGDQTLAATVQTWLENTVTEYLNIVYKHSQISTLCLSGGVVANIIMNLNIYERTPFKEIYIVPFMGDDGVAAGGALLEAIHQGIDLSWVNQRYPIPYLGRQYSTEEILTSLDASNKVRYTDLGKTWYEQAAQSIADGKVIAVFQGRDEFGPRALGNRSILANPVLPDIKNRINNTIKKRPKYQPFCPSILEEERERLFEDSFSHKHMAIAFRLKKEYWDALPCATHIDGTARPQFIQEQDNPAYYQLIKAVKTHTGFGAVINTSFNLHGRTMVHTPSDALTDFIDCNIDELYIEGYCVKKI